MQTRQRTILELLVKEYIRTAEPVGSQVLVRKCKLNFSPATMRNEMVELEETGYLFQPHTSAGRVPTDKGYRFYVNQVMPEIPKRARNDKAENRLKKMADDFQNSDSHKFIKEISKVMSEFSRGVGLCGFLDDDEFYSSGLSNLLKAPEFEDNSGIASALGIFDYLDQEIKKIFEDMEKDIEVFIGKENRGKQFNNFSLVISKCRTKEKEKGIIGILGPKRMDYAKNIALVDLMKDMINKSF
jgi:heat-inducible transcriptional repressor